jgi:AcrR family transcriptional regulator
MTSGTNRRARKQPAEVRRETVLDAAVRVFASRSYHAAGTADIAREAGISEPAIYRYFASKRELYLAALERSGSVVWETFRVIAARAGDAAEALSGMGDWYGEMVYADPEYLRLRQRATAETAEDDVRDVLRGFYFGIHTFIRDLFQQGKEQGAFPPGLDAEAAAWNFLAVGQILDLQRLLGQSREETVAICERLVAFTKQSMTAH